MRLFRCTFGVCVLSLVAGTAFGQSNSIRSIVLATTIDQPGSYRLTQNITLASANPAAILVTASGVSIDLNGFEIRGPGNNTGTGIQVEGASGVHIFNGRLSNLGFGVVVSNSSNVTIRDLDIRARGLAVPAPPPETGIMVVESSGVVIDRNNLYSVGLGIFVRGGMSQGNRITNNNISGASNAALGICFNPAPGDPAGPSGDFVANNSVFGFPTGVSITATAGVSVLRDNNIFYTVKGIELNGAPVSDINNTLLAVN
jgi:nitrous oxidase accessory protein NosD